MLLIVMGVTGSGNTTVGRLLAARLGLQFHDADDYHSPENREKISRDVPLADADRELWLQRLARLAAGLEGAGAVLSCSALKSSYCSELVRHSPRHRFVLLELSQAAAAARLEAPPENALRVSAELTPEEIVERVARALGREGYDGQTRTYLAEGSADTVIDEQRATAYVDELLDQLGVLRRVLLVPPDFTRFHSGAGSLSSALYRSLKRRGAHVAVLPATGTHVPVSDAERELMFPGIPKSAFREHSFLSNLQHLGDVPAGFVREVSGGRVSYPIRCEVDRALTEDWDRILSVGQLVPHEVIGIANHNKNIFVGAGGKDVIDRTHFLGAVCNMESIMGRTRTPVRDIFDYMSGAFGKALPPITYLLTVRAKRLTELVTVGLYAGDDNACFLQGAELAREVNIQRLPAALKKVVVNLDPDEFKSTWLGNKAIYRTRLALADDAELLILAPGVQRFGEDAGIDRLIRRHGYHGTPATLSAVDLDPELQASLSAAAHLIHGSSEGRFRINYAAGGLSRDEVVNAGFGYQDPEAALRRYDPRRLNDGLNRLPDGEEIFFISNPALGLWALDSQFEAS
jgi:carbohydrate kinase (thermoresistant glucokinase family)